MRGVIPIEGRLVGVIDIANLLPRADIGRGVMSKVDGTSLRCEDPADRTAAAVFRSPKAPCPLSACFGRFAPAGPAQRKGSRKPTRRPSAGDVELQIFRVDELGAARRHSSHYLQSVSAPFGAGTPAYCFARLGRK